MKHYRPFCFSFLSLRDLKESQETRGHRSFWKKYTGIKGLLISSLVGAITLTSAIVTSVLAENSRETFTWQPYDRKDPLTDKINHRVLGQVTFSDGNMIQALAKCAEDPNGGRYPGLTIAIAGFQASNSAPKALEWHNDEIRLPLLLNGQRHSSVRIRGDNPQANLVGIGFYDPASAKRFAHADLPGYLRLPELSGAAGVAQTIEWEKFVESTGGTLADLLGATSIRVQVPLSDGTADAVELNPQDQVLKNYVQQCSSGF